MPQDVFYSTIGWLGAAAVLYAYHLVSSGRVQGNSIHYQVFNIIGAICLIVNTVHLKAYPSAIVNIVWIVIAVYTLAQAYLPQLSNKGAFQYKLKIPKRKRKS